MAKDPVPPSSPPSAPAAELPDSPFFEPQYNAFTTKSSSPPPLFSSDDSRETADIANYESPRIFKNKRKGAWWNNSPGDWTRNHGVNGDWAQSRGAKKAKISRNYDSGVYMMSDATDSSESLPTQYENPFDLFGTSDAASQISSDSANTSPAAEEEKQAADEEEQRFLDHMNAGLVQNSEMYEFCGMKLQDKHIRQIGKLASVIKNIPDPGDEQPAEGQYRSMVPALYVGLKNNELRFLTPALFEVKNITSLILKDNNIEELPADMGKLSNLAELNISNNKLRWLPFELLKLLGPEGKLEIIGDSGVPWLSKKIPQRFDDHGLGTILTDLDAHILLNAIPDDVVVAQHIKNLHNTFDDQSNREELLWHMRTIEVWPTSHLNLYDHYKDNRTHHTTDERDLFTIHGSDPADWPRPSPEYLARTPVSYFDDRGALLKGSPTPPSSNEDDFAVITETDRGAHGVPASIFAPSQKSSHINSLATMALHWTLRHNMRDNHSMADLRDCIDLPFADALLARAETNDCAGFGSFRKCNVCAREYVVARAEWVEWWMVKVGQVYPFRVAVCSWVCVPEEMKGRPGRELVLGRGSRM